MTIEEFNILSKDLQSIVKSIPLNWGQTQNDNADSQINMFAIKTYSELEVTSATLSEEKKNYLKRRWFLWQCSKCDEFLFCLNENVKPNPNKRDQIFDVKFNSDVDLRFDIKGTLIPKQFRNNVEEVIANPQAMVDFFYQQQSKGIRESYQNRLFIVHHSFRKQEREMYLRCHFDFKREVFKQYSQQIKITSKFLQYQNAKADVIFILENLDKSFTSKFYSVF
jgi:hypothetical protein